MDRVEVVVLLYSLILVHILMLAYLSRLFSEVSCELVFCECEWATLYCAARCSCVASDVAYSMVDAIGFVAVLGGFVGVSSDGSSGLGVVWLGLNGLFVLCAFREFI